MFTLWLHGESTSWSVSNSLERLISTEDGTYYQQCLKLLLKAKEIGSCMCTQTFFCYTVSTNSDLGIF